MLYVLVPVILTAGYFDYKSKRIPDFVTAFGWLCIALITLMYSDFIPIITAGAAFAVVFALNASVAIIKKEPLLGWGDVLLLPVYAAFCTGTANFWLFIFFPLSLLLGYVVYSGKDTHVALAPFLALSAFIALWL
jgi:prepilin signal peptidase PulO-like enzyme (type II secretory pathway)